MLVAVCSHAGSPGASTLALAMAAQWPAAGQGERVLVEADPTGGVLWSRLAVSADPGLSSLAAATRSGLDRTKLWHHAQSSPFGVPVVAAPSVPSIARRSVAVMAAPMGEWSAGQLELDVLVDVGRWGGQHGEAAPLVVAADVTVVVCVPVAEQLVPARQLVATITELGGRPGWCLVGDGPYSPAEVAEASAAPVLGVVPSDPRGAAAWADPESKERTRRRSGVASAAAALSHHLVDQLRPVPEPAPASVIPPAPPTEASPSEPMTDSPAEVSQ